MPALAELEAAWRAARVDAGFDAEVERLLTEYVGRPSRLYRAARFGASATVPQARGPQPHQSARINNCIGQALLARHGPRRLIAETGAGQHGVATATVAAPLFGMPMRRWPHGRQGRGPPVAPASSAWKLLGARVIAVASGTRTLKDAMN
ncbi:MAG: tryptophan synthase subunit beta, partial [Myxococcales bacterium]|nr:tryptophan synthase subunit beta [Myxococcales bacterium]